MKKHQLSRRIVAMLCSVVMLFSMMPAVSFADPTGTPEGGPEPAPLVVTGVSLDATKKTLKIGENFDLTATVTTDGGATPSVIWSSSDDTSVTVVQNGDATSLTATVTALKATTPPVTITVDVDGYSATCEVTVEKKTPNVTVTSDPVEYGQDAVLKVTSDVGGTFFYTVDSGTESTGDQVQVGVETEINLPGLTKGEHTVSYRFVPTDTETYQELTGQSTTVTVTGKVLTVKSWTVANSATKTYDGTANFGVESVTLNGAGNDDVRVELSTVVGVADDKNVGADKELTLQAADGQSVTLTGTDAANYTLDLTSAPKMTGTITAKKIAVASYTIADKTYDGTKTIDSGTVAVKFNDVISGDTVNLTGAAYTADQTEPGDSVAVTVDLTGALLDDANYTLGSGSATNGTVKIVPKAITASYKGGTITKTSDGNTSLTGENKQAILAGITLDGLVSGDEGDVNVQFATSSNPAYLDDSIFAANNAITGLVIELAGNKAGCYKLTNASGISLNAKINAVAVTGPLNLSASSDGKVYLDENNTVALTFNPGQNVNGTYWYTSVPALSGVAQKLYDESGKEFSSWTTDNGTNTIENLYARVNDVYYGPFALTYSYDATGPKIEVDSVQKPDFHNEKIEYTITVTDENGSGVNAGSIQYAVDSYEGATITNWTPANATDNDDGTYTFTVTVPAAGDGLGGYLFVQAADNVGNANELNSYRTLVLEKNVPNVSVTCDDAASPANTHTVRIAACDACSADLSTDHTHTVNPSGGGHYSGIATVTYTLTDGAGAVVKSATLKQSKELQELGDIPGEAFFAEDGLTLGEGLNGSYTLEVTVRDYCGNETTETLTLEFDNTNVQVEVNMTEEAAQDGDGSYYYNADNGGLTVTFTDDYLSAAGSEYKAVVTTDGSTEQNSIEKALTLTTGQTEGTLTFEASEIAGLADGKITVTVTAKDAAQNEATEMKVTGAIANGMTADFVLDKTAPVLTAVASDGAGNFYEDEEKVYNKEAFSIAFTIDEVNFNENSVLDKTTVTEAGKSAVALGVADEAGKHIATLTVSGTAANAVYSPALSFKDKAGNALVIDPNLSFNKAPRDETTVENGTASMVNAFVLDTVAPEAKITYTALDDTHFYADGSVTNAYYNKEFTASFTFSDEDSELDLSKLWAEQTGAAEDKKNPEEDDEGNVTASFTVEYAENVANDVYAFIAYGTDKAGNALVVTEHDTAKTGETAEYTAEKAYESVARKVLDTAAPTYTMNIADPADTVNSVAGGRAYYNGDIAVEAKISDANIDSAKVALTTASKTGTNFNYDEADVDWQDVTLGKADAVEQFDENVYPLTATASEDGVYRFQIDGEDRAGNKLVQSTDEKAKTGFRATLPNGEKAGEFRSMLKVRDTAAPQLDVSLTDGTVFYTAHLGDPKTQENSVYTVSLNQPYRSASGATGTLTKTDCSPAVVTYTIDSTVKDQSLTNDTYDHAAIALAVEGQQIFRIETLIIKDRAGNISTMENPTNKIYLDTEAPDVDELVPTVALTAHASGSGRGEAGTDLYKSDVTVRAVVTDPGDGVRASGLYRVYYKVLVNGEDWTDRVAVSSENGTAGAGAVGYGTSGSGYNSTEQKDEKITVTDTIDFTFDDATFNYNDVRVLVWAEDNAGNVLTEANAARYTFGIDITAPTVRVTYDNNDVLNEKYFKADRTATVIVTERNFDPDNTVISTENGAAISGWEYAAGDQPNGDADTWTCTVAYTQDGDYTFDIAVADLLGHTADTVDYADSAAPTEFTLDKTVPVISIAFDNNNVLNGKYYDAARIASVSIEEHNFSADGVELTTTASIQEGTVVAPAAGTWGGTGDTHTAQVNFSADGNYTMRVEFVDLAGNEAVFQEVPEFVVDTTAPVLEITGVQNQMAYNGDVAPVITYHDINYDASSAGVSIRGYQHPNGENLNGTRVEDAFGGSFVCNNIEAVRENDDVYTATGSVRDLAGNETTVTVVFSVNRFGSTYIIADDTQALLDQYYTNAPQDLHVTEINVDGLVSQRVTTSLSGDVNTLVNGSDYTVIESTPGWHQFDYTILAGNFEAEGAYDVTLYSEDEAGNTSSNRAIKENDALTTDLPINFVVDVTAPVNVVTGVDEGEQYVDVARTVVVRYDDNTAVKSLTLYLDGEVAEEYDAEALAAAGGSIEYTANASNQWQTLEVVSVDMAGNSSERTSVRYLLTDNLFVQYYNNTPLFVISILALLLLAALIVMLIRRRKNRDTNKPLVNTKAK